jgi:hypothetical protein
MHILGVALCFASFIINLYICKKVLITHHLNSIVLIKAILTVAFPVVAIVSLIYHNAYGFDIVVHLIPLNHAAIKIYSMEGLNYIAGAFGLTNVILITYAVEKRGGIMDEIEMSKLKKLFHSSLFVTAIIIAYATLASGALFKALNEFYYSFYDPAKKITLFSDDYCRYAGAG